MGISLPLPFPTFDDFRKYFNFWIDQENKWFYFETTALKVASNTERDVEDPNHRPLFGTTTEHSRESVEYVQDRIVGHISDIVSFPPSLLLKDTSIFSVRLDVLQGTKELLKVEKRQTYGLVFSQITYYERIENEEQFLKDDPRISDQDQEREQEE